MHLTHHSTIDYSSKSTATRGAKRASLAEFEVRQNDAARWVIWTTEGAASNATGTVVFVEDEGPQPDARKGKGPIDIVELAPTATRPETPVPPVAYEAPAPVEDAPQTAAQDEQPTKKRRGRPPVGAPVPQLKKSDPSTIRPTKLVWAIATQMWEENPGVTRKDVLRACGEAGIASNTARTQYQRWFKARNEGQS